MSFLYSTSTIGINASLSSTPLPPAARLLTARLAWSPAFLVPALNAATCLRFSAICDSTWSGPGICSAPTSASSIEPLVVSPSNTPGGEWCLMCQFSRGARFSRLRSMAEV